MARIRGKTSALLAVLGFDFRLIAEHRMRSREKLRSATTRYPAQRGVSHLRRARRRAHHFFAEISFITSISRSRSASSFLSRAFSVRGFFSRFASLGSTPAKRLRHV